MEADLGGAASGGRRRSRSSISIHLACDCKKKLNQVGLNRIKAGYREHMD